MRASGRTIVAISSPPGPGLRGVVRLSGPDARALVEETVTEGSGALRLEERGAFRGRFHDGRGDGPALVLWMPGPRSFTREDVAELHLVGAPPLLARAVERLVELGARVAGPGEFTRRAFESGRIDLTQAEGVLELVEAGNEAELRAANELLSGGLRDRLVPLRDGLDALRALCEASLDFDQDDAGHVPLEELRRLLDRLERGLDDALERELGRVRPTGRARVVLAGAPNAGKSSLFNRLVRPGVEALVADLPGTTRDVLEGVWIVGETELRLLDGPGLETGRGEPDRRGQSLAAREREAADLVLWVVDAAGDETAPGAGAGLLVWNKVDAPGARPAPPGALATSARDGRGLDELAAAVEERLAAGVAGGLGRELSARHQQALARARRELDAARSGLEAGEPLDLVAEVLRDATAALDEVTGATTPEDLLDRIFARFCLGK